MYGRRMDCNNDKKTGIKTPGLSHYYNPGIFGCI